MQSRIPRIIASTFCAILTWLGVAGLAQATLVVGSWDPPYGAPFLDLGWRGQATFFVADSCHTTNGVRVLLQDCAFSEMSVKSARVEFYKLGDPSKATQQVLDFTGDMWLLAAHFDAAGAIDGINAITTPLSMERSLIGEAKLPAGETFFALAFQFQLGVTTAHLAYTAEQGGRILGWNNGVDFPAIVTLQAVPEPATVPAMLLGLLVVGLAARGAVRRRAAQSAADKA
jgi:hypothetical protein